MPLTFEEPRAAPEDDRPLLDQQDLPFYHYLCGLLVPPDAARRVADEQRKAVKAIRQMGRQLSYSQEPIRALHGPLLSIFEPRVEARVAAILLRWAPSSATILQIQVMLLTLVTAGLLPPRRP